MMRFQSVPFQLFLASALIMMDIVNANNMSNSHIFITKLAQSQTKYLTSPRWPLKYPANSDLRYKIIHNPNVNVEKRYYLQIKWLEFDLKGNVQNCSDYVRIRFSENEHQEFTFCSTQTPHTIYTVGQEVEVHFHSGKEGVGFGFRLLYRLVPFSKIVGLEHCRRNIELTSRNGVLSSLRWPSSVMGSCVFAFRLEPDEVLMLNIMDFTVQKSKAECSSYNNYVEIRGNTSDQMTTSFKESCPLTSFSSCDSVKKWSLLFQKRRVFVHVNTIDTRGDSRGFLAGYTVYKKAEETKGLVNRKHNKWIFNTVTIGIITGIFIGVLIVMLTVASVSICLKRGVL